MRRTLIVGDLHGCVDELRDLLSEVGFTEGADQLVSVGDLVNKGPDSRGVLQLVRALGGRAVLGNHDDRVLGCARALASEQDLGGFSPRIRAVAEALDEDDVAWLAALPLTIELDAFGVVVVHAGLLPFVPLGEQPRDLCLTMRSIRADGTGTKRLEEGEPWASRSPGPTHVVFGHDAIRGLQRWPHATGLDTGCVYGGQLSALILPERRIVSVPARRAWCPT